MISGATQGATSYTLKRGLSYLILTLRSLEDSPIYWPEPKSSAYPIGSESHSIQENVIGFLDGLNIPDHGLFQKQSFQSKP